MTERFGRRRASLVALAVSAFALATAAPALAEEKSAPAMWRLADKDSEIFLFGTFHVLPADIEWTTPAYEAAMKKAKTTVVEADVISPEAQAKVGALVQQYGLNPPGVTLSSLVGPERFSRFAEVAARYGAPAQALEGYRPWLAMISLSVLALQQEGFDPNSGVDRKVLARAGEEGDAVDYLETPEYQIQALSSLDGEAMIANFDATLDQFNDFKALTQRMLTAWSQGDVKGLDETLIAPMRRDYPDAFEALLVTRNQNWVAEIKRMMAGEGDYFIAVGAGHLVGEQSVVDLLEKEGFKVKRVQ